MIRIEVVQGDITAVRADAVVNAANSTLLGGGGVDGAIHRAGGPEILEACRELRASTHRDGLPTGDAVATTAGRLPARWVIHTVGPVWSGATDRTPLLRSAYSRSLAVADELRARVVAFPLISAGAVRLAAGGRGRRRGLHPPRRHHGGRARRARRLRGGG